MLLMLLLSLGVGLVVCPPAYAQAKAADEEKRVSLTLKDTRLRDAVEMLFKGTDFQYTIDPNVPNVPITLSIRDTPILQALRLVVKQAALGAPGLISTRENGIIVIKFRKRQVSASEPQWVARRPSGRPPRVEALVP
jgi:type II secretory pathway component HofQ